MNPENTGKPVPTEVQLPADYQVFDIKYLLGRDFMDHHVQRAMKVSIPESYWINNTNVSLPKYVPYKVREVQGLPVIEVHFNGHTVQLTAVEITAIILSKAKQLAESFLGNTVEDVALTIPSSFTYRQRQALNDAAEAVGLRVLRFLSEPSAAAVCPPCELNDISCYTILDFGAGTFDASAVLYDDPVIEIGGIEGFSNLGGNDFDQRLVDHLVGVFLQKYDLNLTSNLRSMCRLRAACERAKRILSKSHHATIEIDSLLDGIDFQIVITRDDYERLVEDLLCSTKELVQRIFLCRNIPEWQSPDRGPVKVCLVGGASRMPSIQQTVMDACDAHSSLVSIERDTATAKGAALWMAGAGIAATGPLGDIALLNVLPFHIGLLTYEGPQHLVYQHRTYPYTPISIFCRRRLHGIVKIAFYAAYPGRITTEQEFLCTLVLSGLDPNPEHAIIHVCVSIGVDASLKFGVFDPHTSRVTVSWIRRDIRSVTREVEANRHQFENIEVVQDDKLTPEQQSHREWYENKFGELEIGSYVLE